MKQGYIKLYRKLIDSRVFKNEGLLKVWIWCLIRANHKGAWVTIKVGKKYTEVWVEPGQFLFGRYSAAKELRMSPSTLWKRIKKLENIGNLNINSNNNYTIITIINWEAYQADKFEGNSKGDHQGTTREPPGDTNKNDNNDKEYISVDLYAFYLDEINPKQKSKKRAISNIMHHLKKHSDDDLRLAIQNYKTIAADREPQYRKDPANFFGKNERPFLDYLPDNFIEPRQNHQTTPVWL